MSKISSHKVNVWPLFFMLIFQIWDLFSTFSTLSHRLVPFQVLSSHMQQVATVSVNKGWEDEKEVMRDTWERILCPRKSSISFFHVLDHCGMPKRWPEGNEMWNLWLGGSKAGHMEKTDWWRQVWGNKNPLLCSEIRGVWIPGIVLHEDLASWQMHP